MTNTDDLRIREIRPLSPPHDVMAELPATEAIRDIVANARNAVHDILERRDDRLVVVIGPCSIHDPIAALDYAERLAVERQRHAADLEILMRVYFEKPRTTIGWKGLINDPVLNGTFRIDEGLRLARQVLLDVNTLGLPAACEFLDMITPQYTADLVGWGAIGARTTESQVHREMASGLSCPVGFKNGTDGEAQVAVDAVLAAREPHHFLTVTKGGEVAIARTAGNRDAHVVLRGGRAGPNYSAAHVAKIAEQLQRAGLPERMVIDVSHDNSGKKPERQPAVLAEIGAQIAGGEKRISGVMIESNLVAGRQALGARDQLVYGQSITDGCVDWETSVAMLEQLARDVRARRKVNAELVGA